MKDQRDMMVVSEPSTFQSEEEAAGPALGLSQGRSSPTEQGSPTTMIQWGASVGHPTDGGIAKGYRACCGKQISEDVLSDVYVWKAKDQDFSRRSKCYLCSHRYLAP